MLRYFIFLPLVLLFGCASQQPLESPQSKNDIIAVGTLADANNPYDMAAAPVITQATVVRISTLRALQRGRIDAATALDMQQCADRVIDAVNAAAAAHDDRGIARAGDQAKSCKLALDTAKGVTK